MGDLVREPTIYFFPDCDTQAELDDALRERCEKIFTEQLAGWFNDETTWSQDLSLEVAGSTFSTIQCWWISAMTLSS